MPELDQPNEPRRPATQQVRLTRRQLSVVHELARGYDIATTAEHRGSGISSTYEIATRICERASLTQWQDIGPWARDHGLVDPNGHENPE